MMPIAYANVNEEYIVRKVGGSPETKRHLENLGFTVGTSVKVINEINGNVIVNVKEARIALGPDMSRKIMV